MKKVLFTLLLLCSALSASAQAKYSIRTGVGVSHIWDDDYMPSFMLNLNSNIRLARGSKWIFSPGATLIVGFYDADVECSVYVPLQVGYTGRVTSKMLFVPKVGLSTGYMGDFVIGPNFELGFEMRHFTFGVDGFISLVSVDHNNPIAFHFNLGYVF